MFDGAEIAVKKRLAVPVRSTGDAWHHLVLTMTCPGGQLQFASISLLVDDQSARADQPDWLKALAPRVPDAASKDEVRLTRGEKHRRTGCASSTR